MRLLPGRQQFIWNNWHWNVPFSSHVEKVCQLYRDCYDTNPTKNLRPVHWCMHNVTNMWNMQTTKEKKPKRFCWGRKRLQNAARLTSFTILSFYIPLFSTNRMWWVQGVRNPQEWVPCYFRPSSVFHHQPAAESSHRLPAGTWEADSSNTQGYISIYLTAHTGWLAKKGRGLTALQQEDANEMETCWRCGCSKRHTSKSTT